MDNHKTKRNFQKTLINFSGQYPIGSKLKRDEFRQFFTEAGFLPKLGKNASKLEKTGYVSTSSMLLFRVNRISLGHRFAKIDGAKPFYLNSHADGTYTVESLDNAISILADKRINRAENLLSFQEHHTEKMVTQTGKQVGWSAKKIEGKMKNLQTAKLSHVQVIRAMKKIGRAY